MSYIFMDESGDLGFDFRKKRTTQYFIITFLFVQNKRPIEKIVKNIYRGLRKKYKKIGILHAHMEEPITKKRLLKSLSEKDCAIMTICLNKKRVYTKLHEEKVVLYNYVSNLLLDRIYSRKIIPVNRKVELIASRRETNKFLNQNFKDYLRKQVQDKHKFDLEISVKTPVEERALQAVDFVSWAIFRKYEYHDNSFYKIIKPRIAEENALFP